MENVTFEEFRTVLNYDVCLSNHIGKREEQQDSVYLAVGDHEVFSILSDGMGGINGGKIASTTATCAFIEYSQYYRNLSKNWLVDTIRAVDQVVYQLKDDHGNPLMGGCTLVAYYIDQEYIQWISVGDSRLYIFRNHRLMQVTTDHNYFYELDEKKANHLITNEEYLKEASQGEQLVSYIGYGEIRLVDLPENPVHLEKDDIILVCSDGLYRTLSDEIITRILESNETMEEAGEMLVNTVEHMDHPFQDNYSFTLVKKMF